MELMPRVNYRLIFFILKKKKVEEVRSYIYFKKCNIKQYILNYDLVMNLVSWFLT